jgi:hypothetical protein
LNRVIHTGGFGLCWQSRQVCSSGNRLWWWWLAATRHYTGRRRIGAFDHVIISYQSLAETETGDWICAGMFVQELLRHFE